MKVESKSRALLKRLQAKSSVKAHKPNVDYCAQFIKQLETLRYKHDTFTVFQDFLEMSAIAIANRLAYEVTFKKRETRYLEIAKRYTKDELSILASLLATVVMALDAQFQDILGTVCSRLDLANHRRGQFFTPYHLAKATAQMAFEPKLMRKCIFHDRVLMIGEPACGSGVTTIALLEAIRDAGFNFQQHTYSECADIDARAVHMTYIQLALLGAPACVFHRNTLSMETFDVWQTPAYWFGATPWKIKRTLEFNQRQNKKKAKTNAKHYIQTTTAGIVCRCM